MSDPNNIIRLVDLATIETQAADWVARLDRALPSDDDLADFAAWKALSPQHQQAAERLESLWSEFDILAQLSPPIQERAAARRVRPSRAGVARSAGRASAMPQWWVSGLVAACLVVAGLGAVTVMQQLPRTQVYDTAVGGQRTVNLEDGSSIQLNTDSRVEVRYSAKARDLRLVKGEAYFEVAPNVNRPFSVYAREGVVRAVGTAFVVRVKGERVEVTVTKGRVELAAFTQPVSTPRLDQIAAVPRRALTMVSATHGVTELAVLNQTHLVEHLDLTAPEATRKLAWRQGMLVFNGESLPDVVADVSRYTDVEIEIADPSLNSLKIGGYFKVGEVEPMLEALESSFGVRVEKLDDKHVKLSAAL
jgi:transmembrane sensor